MGELLLVALTHMLLLVNFGDLFENLRRLVRDVFQVLVELEGLQETGHCKKEKQRRKETTQGQGNFPQKTLHGDPRLK